MVDFCTSPLGEMPTFERTHALEESPFLRVGFASFFSDLFVIADEEVGFVTTSCLHVVMLRAVFRFSSLLMWVCCVCVAAPIDLFDIAAAL